jgi:hypothetical protein
MRITIESNEREGVVPSVPVSTEFTLMETIDGGSPSEALIQAIAEVLPIPTGGVEVREGIAAGPPPEWLVKAIQSAIPPSVQAVVGDNDAGAAPI